MMYASDDDLIALVHSTQDIFRGFIAKLPEGKRLDFRTRIDISNLDYGYTNVLILNNSKTQHPGWLISFRHSNIWVGDVDDTRAVCQYNDPDALKMYFSRIDTWVQSYAHL